MTKFAYAWADIASQNSLLLFCSVLNAIIIIGIGIVAVRSYLEPPLVVDTCAETKPIPTKRIEPGRLELTAFSKKVFMQRFDETVEANPILIAEQQIARKNAELSSLDGQGFSQRLLIKEIVVDKDKITAFGERVLMGSQIKSVLPLNVELILERTKRTPQNPWGLTLIDTVEIREKNHASH